MGLIRTGVLFEIVGTKYSNNGRSCRHHRACGALLYEDALVSIRKVEVEISKIPEPALAVYLVVDGRDTCRVGFLKKNLVKHSNLYVGKLAQVNEIYSDESASSIKKKINHQNGGCARAELLEWVDENDDSDKIDENEDNDKKDNGDEPAKKRKRDE